MASCSSCREQLADISLLAIGRKSDILELISCGGLMEEWRKALHSHKKGYEVADNSVILIT